MKDYYVACSQMTVCVTTKLIFNKMDEEVRVICKAPPIVKKFEGQAFGNLCNWMENINREGNVIAKELSYD